MYRKVAMPTWPQATTQSPVTVNGQTRSDWREVISLIMNVNASQIPLSWPLKTLSNMLKEIAFPCVWHVSTYLLPEAVG